MSEEMSLEDIPGVGRVTAKKLRGAGVFTVRQLALYTAEELALSINMDPSVAERILSHARSMVGLKPEIMTAKERKVLRTKQSFLTTGVKAIDDLLGGGLIIAHTSTHRLILRKSGEVWKIEVLDSPRITRGLNVPFKITERGVEDIG